MLRFVEVKVLENYHTCFENSCFQDLQQLSRGTPDASGYDLKACIDIPITLWPNETRLIPTGIAIYINNPNYEAQIRPRSGKGSKGLILGNTIGTIDSDYQGEILICIWNRSEEAITIMPGEAIAQLVFCPVDHPTFSIVEKFSEVSQRNVGGFGHTDGKFKVSNGDTGPC